MPDDVPDVGADDVPKWFKRASALPPKAKKALSDEEYRERCDVHLSMVLLACGAGDFESAASSIRDACVSLRGWAESVRDRLPCKEPEGEPPPRAELLRARKERWPEIGGPKGPRPKKAFG